MQNNIVISIKPQYSNLIYDNLKTVELRRKIGTKFVPENKIYIYSSSPVKMLTGEALIKKVTHLPKEELKTTYLIASKISEQEFDKYFENTETGYAITLKNVKKYRKPIDLITLKSKGFRPPQSYSYQYEPIEKALEDIKCM